MEDLFYSEWMVSGCRSYFYYVVDESVDGAQYHLFIDCPPRELTNFKCEIGYFDMKLNQELFAIVNEDNEVECDWSGPYIDEDREYLESWKGPGERVVKIKVVPVDNE